jgi:hypothetical protein
MDEEAFNIGEIINLIKSSSWEDIKLAGCIIDKMSFIPERLRKSFYRYYITFSSNDQKVVHELQEMREKFK